MSSDTNLCSRKAPFRIELYDEDRDIDVLLSLAFLTEFCAECNSADLILMIVLWRNAFD